VSENQVQEGVASGILGKKLGMTQVFVDDERVPVTVIQAGPCVVLQVKTEQTDGYNAVQLGLDEKKPKRTTRPLMGHFAKAGTTPKKLVREFRAASVSSLKPGQAVGVSVLAGASLVDVQGTSKGKGFAGVIKRHNFGGGRASHGCSRHHRKPGSIGRLYSVHKGIPKNKKMAGRLGGEKVTVRGLTVVEIDPEKNVLLIKGPVPGANGSYVVVRRSVKDPGRTKPEGELLY
jgi:large subunit ribosomal protein L3